MNEAQINRVYPIRKTRNKWKIPLFCYHKCSEDCNTFIIKNSNSSDSEDDNYILIDNDMNNSLRNLYKKKNGEEKNRRKRTELSISATKTVNKHNISIIVQFD